MGKVFVFPWAAFFPGIQWPRYPGFLFCRKSTSRSNDLPENLGGFPRTPHPSGPYWSFSSQSPGHSPLPKALYFVLGPLLPQWVIRCTAESFDHWSYFPSLPSSKATPEESYSCSHCVFPACAHISSRTTCGRSEAGKRRANRRMHN